jgi:hypothetical protein
MPNDSDPIGRNGNRDVAYNPRATRSGGVGDQQGGRRPREKCVEPETSDVTIKGNLCTDPASFRSNIPNLLD